MLNLKNPAYRTRPPAICRRPLAISLSRFPSLRNGTLRTAPQKTPLAKGQTAFLPPRSPVRLLRDFSALILSRFACSRRAASLRLGFKTKSASQSFGFSPSLQSIRPAHNGSALPSYFRLKKASLPRYCATSPSSPQSPLHSGRPGMGIPPSAPLRLLFPSRPASLGPAGVPRSWATYRTRPPATAGGLLFLYYLTSG